VGRRKRGTSEIIVNTNRGETRVALLENGVVTELYLERRRDRGVVGNVYKGVVTKVLPGMQAAFVDLGMERAGFLYVSDVDVAGYLEDYERFLVEEGEVPELDEEPIPAGRRHERRKRGQHQGIEELLQVRQELLVQLTREPMGSKGPRLTSYITLPGRYLVYMPTVDHVGVSRRIESEVERRRLRELVKEIKADGAGYIIRTESEGHNKQEFVSDMEFLSKVWQDILRKSEKATGPCLIHPDLNLVLRTVRDLFTHDVDRMVMDNRRDYEQCLGFVTSYLPHLRSKVEHYRRREPIFDAYGIELEIERALGKRVWLKSGGYILIEETEALVTIDVNTGRYVGKRNPEETILKTNLEAIKEIVYQLRLRNIGGIIIIDFIDMEKEGHREKVFATLEEALKADRARTSIHRPSELGLVQMTRKRVRQSLGRVLCDACPYCDGRGAIKSSKTVCYEVMREIRRASSGSKNRSKVVVTVHPDVADMLLDEESASVDQLESELKRKIVIKADYDLHREQYDVVSS